MIKHLKGGNSIVEYTCIHHNILALEVSNRWHGWIQNMDLNEII
jgi:hypothetical protein